MDIPTMAAPQQWRPFDWRSSENLTYLIDVKIFGLVAGTHLDKPIENA